MPAGSRRRQGEVERRASSELAFGPDPSPLGLHQLFHHGKAQSCTAAGPRSRPVDPIEAVEDVGKILRGYAGTGIGHAHPGKAARICRGTSLPVSYTHLRAHETRHDLV